MNHFSSKNWLIITILWLLSCAAQAACNTDISPTRPDSRYHDNGDGTVTDRATRLMWKRCHEGVSTTATSCGLALGSKPTWQEALQAVAELNHNGGFAGYTDWRLPNINELASLTERQCYSPAINSNLFPSLIPNISYIFWSSSRSSTNPAFALGIEFLNGATIGILISDTAYLRLVRDGQ